MCLLGLVRVVQVFIEKCYSARSLPTLILLQINTSNHMLSSKNTDLIPQLGQRQMNREGDGVKTEQGMLVTVPDTPVFFKMISLEIAGA